jgi:hypothetical protein
VNDTIVARDPEPGALGGALVAVANRGGPGSGWRSGRSPPADAEGHQLIVCARPIEPLADRPGAQRTSRQTARPNGSAAACRSVASARGGAQKRCQSQRPAGLQPVSLRDRSARSLAGTRPPRARSGRSRADLPQMSCTSSWTPFCRRGRPLLPPASGGWSHFARPTSLHGSRQPSAAARRDIPTGYRGLTPMSLRPLACCWVSPGSDGARPSHRCRASSNGALPAGQIKAILRRWRTPPSIL